MTDGYIYCFSNPSYGGLVKVGMTTRSPEDRAKELFVTGVPTPFKIEFAKKVSNPASKEATLHMLLEEYTERTSHRREFFSVSPAEVRHFFELSDGEWWKGEEVGEEVDEEVDAVNPTKIHRGRNRLNRFTNGQRIRHNIKIIDDIWVGTYDSSRSGILCNGELYTSLSAFSVGHYTISRPNRTPSSNGWIECECEVDGDWISTNSLFVF